MKLLTWLWRRPGRKSGAQSKKILDTPNSHHRIAWVNSHGLSSPEYGRMDKVVPHLKERKHALQKLLIAKPNWMNPWLLSIFMFLPDRNARKSSTNTWRTKWWQPKLISANCSRYVNKNSRLVLSAFIYGRCTRSWPSLQKYSEQPS